jgi:hypothetical protein
MAKTLLTIRDQVRSFLDEPSTKEADWTDDELNVLINTYYHKTYTAVLKVFENYAPLHTAYIDSVANQQEYDISTLTDSATSTSEVPVTIRRVEINYDVDATNSTAERAYPINIDAVRRDLAVNTLGPGITTGANYYLVGNKIGFIRIPDKNGTNAIEIWYNPQKNDLSADSDTIDLPYADRDWMLIAYGATAEALRFGQQESGEADKFDAKFIRGIEMMQEDLEDRVSEETKVVIDTSGQSIDFQDGYGGF